MLATLCAVLSLAAPQDFELANAHVCAANGKTWEGALVVAGGRIAPPGTPAPAGAERIDLHGAFVLPGLQDAHGHLLGLGEALEEVDLTGCSSYAGVIARVVAAAKGRKPGEWIVGRGWDQNLWPKKDLLQGMPHHAELSAETMDSPVWLVRVDGHAGLANLPAMRAAGLDKGVSAPEGGEILHDDDGEPTGVLIDNAMRFVQDATPEADIATVQRRLLRAQQECLAHGLTCVHDAGISRRNLDELKLLHKAGKWHLRAYELLDANETDAIRKGPWHSGDGLLQARAVKGYADGALGSRGAALLAEYSDWPAHRGLMRNSAAVLKQLAQLCADSGMQLCVHAIGDAANRAVLDACAAVTGHADRKALRFRIEHAQVVAPQDFPRFAELAVLPSMQPTHLTSDMPWAVARLGPERTQGAYAWKSFLALGLPLPFGSDFPVESVDPLRGIYAAVTTRPFAGGEPLRPDQQLDRAQALKGFTADAAYAMFAEHELGAIEPGRIADLTIVDRDLLTCPEREILQAKVLFTVVGGRVAFRADAR
jgi:predicted amidohydrolase YtcJ